MACESSEYHFLLFLSQFTCDNSYFPFPTLSDYWDDNCLLRCHCFYCIHDKLKLMYLQRLGTLPGTAPSAFWRRSTQEIRTDIFMQEPVPSVLAGTEGPGRVWKQALQQGKASAKRGEGGRTMDHITQSSVNAAPCLGLFTPQPLCCWVCSITFIYGYLFCAHSGVEICTMFRNYKSRHSPWPLSISVIKIIVLELVFTQNQAETHQLIISLRPTNKHRTGTSFKSLRTWTNFETLP